MASSDSTQKGKNDIVWIEFVDPTIGLLQRASLHHLFTLEITSTWTPITRVCTNIQLKNGLSFNRKQFLVQLACARTIYRSQGLTMNKLAFDPKQIEQHRLFYIALSRVKNIDSLYLITKLHHSNFFVSQKVVVVTQRLRKKLMLQS